MLIHIYARYYICWCITIDNIEHNFIVHCRRLYDTTLSSTTYNLNISRTKRRWDNNTFDPSIAAVKINVLCYNTCHMFRIMIRVRHVARGRWILFGSLRKCSGKSLKTTIHNNNGRNGSCLTWLATSLEEKRRWLIINASPRGQCSK